MIETETLIVGGGLSGLAVARALHRRNKSFHLVEARDLFGGRILTHSLSNKGDVAHFDLGPAWFWPGQPRLEALINALGLRAFTQFSDGLNLYETEHGQVLKGQGHAAMQGSFRLEHGLSALVDAVVRDVPEGAVSLNTRVLATSQTAQGMETRVQGAGFEQGTSFEQVGLIRSQHVVLALPPRLAAASISFGDALPATARQAMAAIPTWMAGHAKAVAIYPRPFWREAGLSGDAMSRHGPLAEIHDASPASGGPYALFGFVGVPATARRDEARLRSAILAQFGRLFGPEAERPLLLLLKDWAQDDLTAAPQDLTPLAYHPDYGLPAPLTNLCEGRLLLGSTETAPQFGGYLEGALEAAERCVAQICAR